MKPVIAIVGRPNVGKSTLFNRLSEKNKAIVIDEPGATRDRNYADCTWQDKNFTLIDTGGFEPVSTERILVQMREQTELAIEEADIILFLMDGKEGLAPSDIEITRLLRKVKKPVFFVINKIDGPKHDNLSYEFYQLGTETIYSISAQHGVGIYELMDDVARCLSDTIETAESDKEAVRIALIGKPNVGKSSLLNKILGYERTIVNPLPGTTRDAIDSLVEFNDKRYLLIDTAGIRRKSRITHVLEKYSIVQALKAIDRCDIALLLIDAEEGITEQDAKIAGLTVEKGKGCIIIVNKWDIIEKDNATVGNYVRNIKDTLKFMDYAPIVFISALTGQRIPKIFDTIESVYSQYVKRVPTADLNRVVRDIIDSKPPPRHQNRPNPFSYVTQASVAPPTLIFFIKEPKAVHFSYRRFLINRIREACGFEQVPIKIVFKRKHKSLSGKDMA
jgi:GTPase